MHAPTNLHILAIASGLFDEDVVTLWNQAREQVIGELGSDSHPEYLKRTEAIMLGLIEDVARTNIQTDMVPWVMFDIHVGMAMVKARDIVSSISAHVHDYFAEKQHKDKDAA